MSTNPLSAETLATVGQPVVSDDVWHRFRLACTSGLDTSDGRYNAVLCPSLLDTYAIFEFAEAHHGEAVTRHDAMWYWRSETKQGSDSLGFRQHAMNFGELAARGIIVCANAGSLERCTYRIDHDAKETKYLLRGVQADAVIAEAREALRDLPFSEIAAEPQSARRRRTS